MRTKLNSNINIDNRTKVDSVGVVIIKPYKVLHCDLNLKVLMVY